MHSGLYWGRKQEGAESLVAWIDSEQQRATNPRWGLWGGLIGGLGGLTGGAMGVLGSVAGIGPDRPLFYLPLTLFFVASAGVTVWVVKKDREQSETWGREARNQMKRLLVARWHGDLRGLLGDEGLRTLDRAASLVLQCKASLNAPAWRAAGGSLWSELREKSLRGLDSAMARLLIVVTSSGPNPESEAILQDLEEMSDEVAKAAKRHALATGRPSGGAEGLRDALRELKEVSAADEEFFEQRTDRSV
ncbi:MAG: hypothetical protein JST30_15190 [Armatimonadetes bacterium]|nr:hypothetical protein [Armatimonadota bacterium]